VTPSFQLVDPILTPYDERGGVATAALEAHAGWLAEQGADGFFVCGPMARAHSSPTMRW
jgi:dihydrodipicolinate synthase/N-acetylneuraminate lyase